MQRNIILIGFMGTGKTSVGRLLAARTGMTFVDTDSVIVSRAGKSIPEIFQYNGEDYFRALEHEAIKELANRRSAVIATGGGAVLNPENMRILKESGIVVALKARIETIWNRIQGNNDRPLLSGRDSREKLENLYMKRLGAYDQAHIIIETDEKTPLEIADEIMGAIYSS